MTDGEWRPEDVERVIHRLEEERPQLGPMDLDDLKQRTLARAGSRTRKGAALKGRVAVAVLSLGLIGAGAGGVVAGSGGSSNGASSACAQYHKHCHKHHKPKPHTKGAHHVKHHSAKLRTFLLQPVNHPLNAFRSPLPVGHVHSLLRPSPLYYERGVRFRTWPAWVVRPIGGRSL